MTSASSSQKADSFELDSLTGGAFSAQTAGERAARIRQWLASEPAPDQLAAVFKELSVKDKGAAKLVRERIDEARRQKGQEALVAEWVHKAQGLLALDKLNIADAMAWQRDAAKAGAPLSREPLSLLKTSLADRVRAIEDLQHRVQVQREAAVLLAQRIEVLSTKPWAESQAASEGLRADVLRWQEQAQALTADAAWSSVEARFPTLLDNARAQLQLVWDAFDAALTQTVAAAQDASLPLPPVPVWADELRTARGEVVAPAPKPKADPAVLAAAKAAVEQVVQVLETELAQGHGKASAGAAGALRAALKEHGKWIDAKLDSRAHAALAAAGELEGWQRWRADQLRAELVAKAEGLLQRPAGQALGGRKLQESVRSLREQWKQTDQGGQPNHGLWKRFDAACNEAYKHVEAWLEKTKAEAAEHRKQRLDLVEEVKAWTQAQAEKLASELVDWKSHARALHQFADRWRDAGHVGDKVFAELQSVWKAAYAQAAAPLEAAQAQSLLRRQAMIEEARVLGAAASLRVDAVKALQQRWQAEAHAVPLDRRQEQKLWDAFRQPIDEAFNRKSAQREQQQAALSAHDQQVLQAARAVEQASGSGDASAIRSAMAALEAALREQAAPPENLGSNQAVAPENTAQAASENIATETPKAAVVAKPVVAVRGDDRPGQRRDAPTGRDARPLGRDSRPGAAAARPGQRDTRMARPAAPRLGDAAFRAQRDAMEKAQAALRSLAAQAHGEALTQLLSAWEGRDAAKLPGAQALGSKVQNAVRVSWSKALEGPAAASEDAEALLRLEMAAEVPTPAEQLPQRRQLQLQMLTRRNAPTPAQTWEQDVAAVLRSPYGASSSRRLQAALKVLLRR
ncbi:DUF349 domain-containing protein [Curvibacter sp. APW13]|uniref:DUF349 domain-containing protein n=1 Tax=Curvibacter sp. APW13 TaxID=3077236 RepID=UPI0028DFDAC2|nr:DUF349 domain-containing protein [Curvibacter sp. APW13]MDT8991418.1 DUF349 domain-containing protein [Curvibacter sp. APW13]